MIRLTLYQFRIQAWIAIAALAAVAITFAVTRPSLSHLYSASGIAACQGPSDCGRLAATFITHVRADGAYPVLYAVGVIVMFLVPAIIGMFWGAPLVASELEDGTFRLAWTQSVTRTRWLAVRLAVTGLASMAAAGLLSLLVTWWASPLDRAGLSRFATFDQRDIVPIGYAAFVFALGVTVGAAIRRTLPAMAVTLVSFAAARMAVTYWVRPRMLSPLVLIRPVNVAGYGSEGFLPIPIASPSLQLHPPDLPNAWITSIDIIDKSGGRLPAAELARFCPGLGQGRPGHGLGHTQAPASAVRRLQECGARLSALYHEAVSYQPASRYWPLQWYELAIFLAAALILGGLAIWRVRRIS